MTKISTQTQISCRHMVFEPCVSPPPCGRLGDKYDTWSLIRLSQSAQGWEPAATDSQAAVM